MFSFLNPKTLESNEHFITSELLRNISIGYSTEDEDRAFKKEYRMFIRLLLRVWLSNYYMIKEIDTVTEKIDTVENSDKIYAKIVQRVDTDYLFKMTGDLEYNPFEIMSKKQYRASSKLVLDSIAKELPSVPEFTKPVEDYINFKLMKIYTQKAVLNKNDVLDMIILYSLNLSDFLFVTLDTQLQNAIQVIHPASYSLCTEWGLVK